MAAPPRPRLPRTPPPASSPPAPAREREAPDNPPGPFPGQILIKCTLIMIHAGGLAARAGRPPGPPPATGETGWQEGSWASDSGGRCSVCQGSLTTSSQETLVVAVLGRRFPSAPARTPAPPAWRPRSTWGPALGGIWRGVPPPRFQGGRGPASPSHLKCTQARGDPGGHRAGMPRPGFLSEPAICPHVLRSRLPAKQGPRAGSTAPQAPHGAICQRCFPKASQRRSRLGLQPGRDVWGLLAKVPAIPRSKSPLYCPRVSVPGKPATGHQELGTARVVPPR